MFRKMRKQKQQISTEECIKILREEPRGVLAMAGEDGYPYALPLDFFYDESNGKIYLHGAKIGHKIDALRKDNRVSFCIYNEGYRNPGDWALNITSVIIFGRIRFVEDLRETLEKVVMIGLKYFPTQEEVIEITKQYAPAVQVLELTIDHMTGKLVYEK